SRKRAGGTSAAASRSVIRRASGASRRVAPPMRSPSATAGTDRSASRFRDRSGSSSEAPPPERGERERATRQAAQRSRLGHRDRTDVLPRDDDLVVEHL